MMTPEAVPREYSAGERLATLEAELRALKGAMTELKESQDQLISIVGSIRERLSGASGAVRAVLTVMGLLATFLSVGHLVRQYLGGAR
jgi:hypothetical protein